MAGAAIGSAIAGVVGNVMSMRGQKKINREQIALSREQMQFQERMSSTAHQREVADLKQAGLNPILSGTGGSGASTPTGAMASLENPAESWENLGATASSAVSAGLQARLNKQAVRAARAEADKREVEAQEASYRWNIGRAVTETEGGRDKSLIQREIESRVSEMEQSSALRAKDVEVRSGEGARAALDEDFFRDDWPKIRDMIDKYLPDGISSALGLILRNWSRR